MNDKLKLFLLFQILPASFLCIGLLQVTNDMTHSYQFFGEETEVNMTNWERNPQLTIYQFMQTIEFVVVTFLAGLPFELILFYFDKQDQIKSQKVKREKLRYT